MPDIPAPAVNQLQTPDYSKTLNALAQQQLANAHSQLYDLQAAQYRNKLQDISNYRRSHELSDLAAQPDIMDSILRGQTMIRENRSQAYGAIGTNMGSVPKEERRQWVKGQLGEMLKQGQIDLPTATAHMKFYDHDPQGFAANMTGQTKAAVDESSTIAPKAALHGIETNQDLNKEVLGTRSRQAGELQLHGAQAGTPTGTEDIVNESNRALQPNVVKTVPINPNNPKSQPSALGPPDDPNGVQAMKNYGAKQQGMDFNSRWGALSAQGIQPHQAAAHTAVIPQNYPVEQIANEIPNAPRPGGRDPTTGKITIPPPDVIDQIKHQNAQLPEYVKSANIAHQQTNQFDQARDAILSGGAKTGPGREGMEHVAGVVYGLAAATGMNQDKALSLTKSMTGMDLSSQELLKKPLVRQGLLFAREAGGARQAFMAIQTELGASPSPDMTRKGVLKLIDTIKAQNQWMEDRSKYANTWYQKNQNMGGFNDWWNQNHPLLAYTSRVEPQPFEENRDKRVPGVTYSNGKGTGVWNPDAGTGREWMTK